MKAWFQARATSPGEVRRHAMYLHACGMFTVNAPAFVASDKQTRYPRHEKPISRARRRLRVEHRCSGRSSLRAEAVQTGCVLQVRFELVCLALSCSRSH